ncbi:MAG: MmcQ/YjbR family DNA-binding protein [Oscillospiraceae bacterium]|nr:MmcQ/YjbR family DNA-binding protein [Oscillospiraceae bacterium]
MDSLRKQIFEYVKKTYDVEPDCPFATDPDTPVLRHRDNRKWFAIFMEVSREKLGLKGAVRTDVVNLKCGPMLSGALRMREGIFPAYHMHRENWVTVLLDGTVPIDEICPLVDLSFELTADRKRRNRKVSWLIPANPRLFDLDKAIRESEDGCFLWKQSSKVVPGDTLYIYVGAPVSGIRYRCRAVETDMPYSYSDRHIRITKVMRLKAEKTFERQIGRDILRDHGVTTVRGPRYMPESLIEEIEGPAKAGGDDE